MRRRDGGATIRGPISGEPDIGDAAPAGVGKRNPRAPGGAGTPLPGHDDSGARSSLTCWLRPVRKRGPGPK